MSLLIIYSSGLTCEQVEAITASEYGLTVKAESLPGYKGQNFRLRAAGGEQYVCKLCFEKPLYDQLDLENQAMLFLHQHAREVNTPVCLPSVKGAMITCLETADGGVVYVRLLSFLQGTFLVDVPRHADQLLFALGSYFGRIDHCLQGFFHPAAHRRLPWDLKQVYQVVSERLQFVDAPEKQRALKRLLEAYQVEVVPFLAELRSSVIHNDGNDYNVLIEAGAQVVAGVIDFGDMVHSHTVNELVIVATYAMLDKQDPLHVLCQVAKGYHLAYPLQDNEIRVLFRLVMMRLCASIAIAAESYRHNPENEYLLVSQGPGWNLLQALEKIEPDYATACLFEICGISVARAGRVMPEILAYRQQHLGKTLSVSYKTPLKIVRGCGQYLFNERGERFLDMVNNVCHVGHCHPKVVRAGQRQMALLNTNTRYLHDNIIDYTERLLATFPPSLCVAMFVNSGSEANELAMRLARCHTKSREMIVVDGAYHGNTQGCIDISPYKFDGPGGQGAPDWVHKVIMPDSYRGSYKGMMEVAGRQYADDVARVVQSIQSSGRQVGAYICESFQGVGGQIIMPPGYLQHVYAHIRKAGGVCIADEVQVGFGRAGTHFWAYSTQDVAPDIVTLGKPMGNGHPMAAVITTTAIAESFVTGMEYFNTFGGNPVSCAIGLAVLDVVKEEGLMAHAEALGLYLQAGLRSLAQRYPVITDVRGRGLFIGAEFVKDPITLEPAAGVLSEFTERMRDRNILLSTDGPLHNVLKIKPPMVFDCDNADEFLNKSEDVLAAMF